MVEMYHDYAKTVLDNENFAKLSRFVDDVFSLKRGLRLYFCGSGGEGKTTLARKMVDNHFDNFYTMFPLDAGYTQHIQQLFREYLEKKYGFRKFFDLEVYSFDYGVQKPERAFVDVLLKVSGFRPSDMFMVDDSAEALEPIRKSGMRGSIYTTGNINKLRTDLRDFGVDC